MLPGGFVDRGDQGGEGVLAGEIVQKVKGGPKEGRGKHVKKSLRLQSRSMSIPPSGCTGPALFARLFNIYMRGSGEKEQPCLFRCGRSVRSVL